MMNNLVITDNQILKTVSSSYWHRFDSAQLFAYSTIGFIIFAIIFYSLAKAYLEYKHDIWIEASEGIGLFMVVISTIITFGLITLTADGLLHGLTTQPSDKTIALLSQAHTTVDDRDTVELVGASSAGYNKTDVSGGLFYVSGSTTDTSTFRYVVQTNGLYQVKTLSDTYGDVNSNDVYINQSNKVKPSLVVEKKHYTNPKIAKLVKSLPDHSSSWTTYTFNVPENSVAKSFNFK